MPNFHVASPLPFGATITTNPVKQLGTVVNTTRGTLSLAVTGFSSTAGTRTVALPNLYKAYFLWRSGFVCQNVGTVATNINISYEGYTGNAYNFPAPDKLPGEVWRVYQPNEWFLPNGYIGSAIVTATNVNGKIACFGNLTNDANTDPTKPGDWSAGYNGFNK
jgi:hypothetical protein